MWSHSIRSVLARLAAALAVALLADAAHAAAPTYDFSQVQAQIDTLVAQQALPGATLVVVRNGAVIWRYDNGSYNTTTRIPIASASKWLSALAIERLVERGAMHWSDTVAMYFPTAPAATQGITLGQLFSHTAGMQTDDAPCLSDRFTSLDACAQQILALPLIYAPGTGFAYGGNSMQVAGRMAEISSGGSWDALFQAQLTGPLGLTDTDYAAGIDTPGYVDVPNPRIAGGVRSTANDYARVVQMVVQRGVWNGSLYLSAAGLTDMQRDQTHGAPVISTPDPLAFGYGYGEWRNLLDDDANAVQVSSTGAYGTSPWIDHETGVAAIFLVDSQYSRIAPDLRVLWANVRNVVQAADAAVATVNLDQFGLTGAWYDPATSGQGLVATVYADAQGAGQGVFAAGWYTFDTSASGGQRWYSLQGTVTAGVGSATLGIYAAGGGNFNAGPVVPALQVGSATLSASDCTHAMLVYHFSDGSARVGAINLARLDANVSCAPAGDLGGAPAGYGYSGAWYAPSTSGQGLLVDVNPVAQLFAAGWYTFAAQGATQGLAGQRWYLIQDNAFSAGQSAKSGMAIYAAQGGTFAVPGGIANATVGSADITFAGCAQATLTYRFSAGDNAGLSGNIALSRVGPVPASCSSP